MDVPNQTLGSQMRAERQRRGMTARELAIVLDVDVLVVARLERDGEQLTPDLLARISRWMNDTGSTGTSSNRR